MRCRCYYSACTARTGKYATSAYLAALRKDAKTLQKVEADLKALHSGLKDSKASAVILNPTLSVQERIKAVDELFSAQKDKPDAVTR